MLCLSQVAFYFLTPAIKHITRRNGPATVSPSPRVPSPLFPPPHAHTIRDQLSIPVSCFFLVKYAKLCSPSAEVLPSKRSWHSTPCGWKPPTRDHCSRLSHGCVVYFHNESSFPSLATTPRAPRSFVCRDQVGSEPFENGTSKSVVKKMAGDNLKCLLATNCAMMQGNAGS